MNTHKKAKLNKITTSLLVAGLIGVTSMPAAAEKYKNYSDNSSYDYARVVDVTPIVETYRVNNPVEKCWNERVSVRDNHYPNRRYKNKTRTPEIVGALIGAAVGNQLGKKGGGKARDVATVAGAVLGGSIGRDVKHQNQARRDYHHSRHHNRHQTRYETVERCEVHDAYTTKEEVVAYDVAYKYRGNVFHTQMNQHPGDKIKVKVTVDPV